MLTRSDVYGIIDTERRYQDSMHNPHEILSSGQTRAQRDLDVTPGLVLLESYVQKAQTVWTDRGSIGSFMALQQIAKIAAIAVRILERAGGSEALLNEGLR